MNRKASRSALAKVARITIECEPEIEPVRGNALASGDPAADKECEDKILARLANGDQWAWCTVVVRASYAGESQLDAIGCCSYTSESAFKRGGYFASMKREALALLASALEVRADEIDEVCS